MNIFLWKMEAKQLKWYQNINHPETVTWYGESHISIGVFLEICCIISKRFLLRTHLMGCSGRCTIEKVFWKISQNLEKKRLCRNLFSIKMQVWVYFKGDSHAGKRVTRILSSVSSYYFYLLKFLVVLKYFSFFQFFSRRVCINATKFELKT